MKVNSLIFVIGFILALTAGYFMFDGSGSAETAGDSSSQAQDSEEEESASEDVDANTEEETASTNEGDTVPTEAEALSTNNCLSCHAVESLGVEGGTTGPDLSQAYNQTEDKHGKDLDSFLQEPTSAVMSTVIEGDPLSDEEREKIVEALKVATEN